MDGDTDDQGTSSTDRVRQRPDEELPDTEAGEHAGDGALYSRLTSAQVSTQAW